MGAAAAGASALEGADDTSANDATNGKFNNGKLNSNTASGNAAGKTTKPNATPTAALSPNSNTAFNPCKELLPRLPGISLNMCQEAALRDAGALSVKGRHLTVRDVKAELPKLRVLVMGGIHGDELSSAAVVMRWIKMAEQSPAGTSYPVHWRFLPVVNPDGLLAQPPHRFNAHGVDLNRNFPTANWDRDAKIYWEKRTRKDPRRWPGPKPLSEPETQFLFKQMQDFKPQLIVSIHAPYGVLDFDGPSVPPNKLGRLFLDQVGIFPGSLGNYGGVQQGIPVVTVELPNSTQTPLDVETKQMWDDLQRWINDKLLPTLKDRAQTAQNATAPVNTASPPVQNARPAAPNAMPTLSVKK